MKAIQTNKHRYYLLVLLIGIILSAFLCIFYSVFYKANEKQEVSHMLDVYTARTEGLLDSLFHKTDILESIIITRKGEVPEETFTDLAKSLIQEKGIRAVQYLPDGLVKYCYPIEGNEGTMGKNIFDNPKRVGDANLAKDTKQIALSGPYHLTQGGFGLVARNPIYIAQEDGSEKFWGFSVIVLDLPEALDPLMLNELERDGYTFQLSTVIDDNGYYFSILLLFATGSGITILCSIIAHMMENRNECLKNYAETDGLTGLVNRRKFLDYMELRCRDKNVSMSLLYIDIDDFKQINDTYGHSQGDVLLKEAARRMKQFITNEDVVARVGGDEFIMIMANQISKEDCREKIEELMELLHQPILLDHKEVQINASIGWSLFPLEASILKELINIADKRMYKIKTQKQQKK